MTSQRLDVLTQEPEEVAESSVLERSSAYVRDHSRVLAVVAVALAAVELAAWLTLSAGWFTVVSALVEAAGVVAVLHVLTAGGGVPQ